jgi:hypothetical protein
MTTTGQPPAITGNVLFYSQPEPLSPEMHGKIGVKNMDGPFGFAKAGHAVPLTVGEFPSAASTGPILVMGLNAGDNMFLRPDGLFEAGVYIPAYIRRYPFIFANDDAAKQMVLCIDRAAEFVVDKGFDQPFFEADGQPSLYTKNCIEFCNNFEFERQKTQSFVQILNDLDLFESKTANFTPVDGAGVAGEPQKIAEYFGVSEEKLSKLPVEKYIELRDNGALPQIYAHLISLLGWDRLVTLTLVKQFEAQKAANS